MNSLVYIQQSSRYNYTLTFSSDSIP